MTLGSRKQLNSQRRGLGVCPALDTALDRTVVGGYSKLGYRVRRRGWRATDLRGLGGKVVVVTGATSGIGLAAAEGLARLGATVWLAVRDEERGEAARATIARHSGNSDVHVGLCDLSNHASVRSFAAHLGSSHLPAGRADQQRRRDDKGRAKPR